MKMIDFDDFQVKFYNYRIDNKLTQEEFSEMLDVGSKTVLRVESGLAKPSTKIMVNFLNLLNLNVEKIENNHISESNKDLYLESIRKKISSMDSKEKSILHETIKIFLNKG